MLARDLGVGALGFLGVMAAALLTGPGDAAAQAAGEFSRRRPRPAGEGPLEKVYYDAPDEQGRLSGGFTMMPVPVPGAAAGVLDAPVTTIMNNGPPANRIDLVFVGDGYLETELDTYAAHVNNGVLELFGQEPFSTYATFFNAHRVDVVSNESGVDNDPTPPIDRDTALDMAFWCNDIERLLCVNVGSAYQYAANAPQADHVFAVANSTKYGGAGYSGSDLATYSGGNSAAAEVAIHEAGHSLGNLADEYDYNDGATYTGPEPDERNVSVFDAAAMAATGTKWADWLGDPGVGFGGLVDTYEGAYYHQYGVYRPTLNSKMRSLGHPFNLPSAEGLILEIYRIVNPIDEATPTAQTLAGTETVFVDPVVPVGHALDVQWSLDGGPIPDATGTTLDLGALGLALGAYELAVTVTDPTSLVRDESARSAWMTETLTWDLLVTVPGDLNGDFKVDVRDFLYLLSGWGPCLEPCPPTCLADLDGDCTGGVLDFLIMLANWTVAHRG
jgi:hypothetical protein